MNNFFSTAAALERNRVSFVVITLTNQRGHTPADPGAKAIVSCRGLECGTVGGGKVEWRALQLAQELLQAKAAKPLMITWNLQTDIGMSCGGEATFLFEPQIYESWKISIFGAGHVAQALVRALAPLSCQVTCIDHRIEWMDRLPKDQSNLRAICVEAPAGEVEKAAVGTFFAVLTQGHATDVPILEKIFRHHPSAPYIGCIGSRLKADKLRKELADLNVPLALLEKLRCPMGFEIGTNDPAEIAVSITAQLLEVRDQERKSKN